MNFAEPMIIIGLILHMVLIAVALSIPVWGYSVVFNFLQGKHKALRVNSNKYYRSTSIIASVGTTTAGVFLIQTLPLIFSIINDLSGEFAVPIIFGDHMSEALPSGFVNDLYGVTAQIGDILQTAAPMAAVGLGGFNLINNISRGLPAIKRDE